MYLYELDLGQAVTTIDYAQRGTISRIDRTVTAEDRPDDQIHITDANGCTRAYARWMVRRVCDNEPPF